MAKSIIAGEYILQIADNGHVDVVRVFRNAYQTMKDIAAENNFEVEEKWNTQTLGSKLVKQFGDGKTAKFKDITINKMDSGKIEIFQECKNTIDALRTIAKQMNYEYDDNWNTQTFGAKMAAYLEEHKPEADNVLQTPNAKPAAKEEAKVAPEQPTKHTYTIELAVRGKGVQALELDEDEKDDLLEEDLENAWFEWAEEKDYDFLVEGQYLTWGCDRYRLTIKDENGNVVYNSTDVKELNDFTYDDDDNEIEGWEFKGLEDGFYLTHIQTLQGCFYSGQFELDTPFDKDKLYLVRDTVINDELMSDDVFPMDKLYYQRGEKPNMEEDIIELDSDLGEEEQYYDTYLMEVSDGDYWHNLQEED